MHAVETPPAIVDSKPDKGGPNRRREWTALLAIVAVAAGLRLWNLDQNGYGNFYYAAAVRSMLASGTNFFFGAFDPLGFVTVDKPPAAIWIQAASAKLLGFRGVSLLLPDALMGIASVVLTYYLVRRVFGAAPALLAGLVLAITPIAIAVDRDNLPDSSLVFVLLSAWALSLAAETGRLRPLLVSSALVGIGFNIKMLAAFVVLPTFYLCYLLAAPVAWRTKLWHLASATVVLAAVSLSWAFAVELTPKSRRPYIGGSRNNSALDLALGYNGLGRVFGGSGNFRPGGRPGFPGRGGPPAKGAEPSTKAEAHEKDQQKAASDKTQPTQEPEPTLASSDRAMGTPPGSPGGGPPPGPPGVGFPPPGPFGPGGRFPGGMPPMFGGPPGLLRFAMPLMAGQITWLFPIAILGASVAAMRIRRQWPISAERLALLLWTGWLGTHWFVFSFAQGIFHEYYTVIMAPAVAALAGIGGLALYDQWRHGIGRGFLPTALILTAAWQAYIVSQSPGIRPWLLPVLGVGTLVSVVGLVSARWLTPWRHEVRWVKLATAIGLTALLVGPACWSLGPVIAHGNGMMPAATPPALFGDRENTSGMPPMPPFGMEAERNEKLIAFLRANRDGERIFVAAPSSMDVTSIIINTGETAVSLGGFMGADPVLTKEDFARMVDDRQVRFVLIGGGPGGGGPPPGGGPPGAGPPFPPGGPPFPPGGPGGPGNSEVMDWVRDHGKVVDKKLWQTQEHADDDEPDDKDLDPQAPPDPREMGQFFRRMRRMARLYDCRPELGLKASPLADY
jgi:4-amino-4-deoxy-L-arabinose transferase-like glycosyltransferase